MAICRNCGNKYFSKICPSCNKEEFLKNNLKNINKTTETKKIYTSNKNTNFNKTYTHNKNNDFKKYNIKTIGISIIAICLIIITIIVVVREYKEYQTEQQVIKMLYGTDDDEIERINKKLEKSTEKNMKILREMFIPK